MFTFLIHHFWLIRALGAKRRLVLTTATFGSSTVKRGHALLSYVCYILEKLWQRSDA
jgi:hypothetical protein